MRTHHPDTPKKKRLPINSIIIVATGLLAAFSLLYRVLTYEDPTKMSFEERLASITHDAPQDVLLSRIADARLASAIYRAAKSALYTIRDKGLATAVEPVRGLRSTPCMRRYLVTVELYEQRDYELMSAAIGERINEYAEREMTLASKLEGLGINEREPEIRGFEPTLPAGMGDGVKLPITAAGREVGAITVDANMPSSSTLTPE